jgi:hypothetical protein
MLQSNCCLRLEEKLKSVKKRLELLNSSGITEFEANLITGDYEGNQCGVDYGHYLLIT